MLQTGECKFSITRETGKLWETLKSQGHEEEFQQLFWRTQQGALVTQTLRRREIRVSTVSIEKRPGDGQEFLYIKTRP